MISPLLTPVSFALLYLKGQIPHTKVLIEMDGRSLELLLCFLTVLYYGV